MTCDILGDRHYKARVSNRLEPSHLTWHRYLCLALLSACTWPKSESKVASSKALPHVAQLLASDLATTARLALLSDGAATSADAQRLL